LKSRILLVDDHQLIRKAIGCLLESDFEICGEAENGKEAVEKAQELKPDLVLLDLSMPVVSGTEAARAIRKLMPKTKIVFLSMHESETIAELSRLAGADASLSKGCSPEELKQTIAVVLKSRALGASG
jgi:DNA-binding NarL/FixJ family response regulator